MLPDGYAIIASSASDGDYTISYQAGTLFVTPAPLLATANTLSKVYGAPLPALSSQLHWFCERRWSGESRRAPLDNKQATADSPVLPGGYAIIAMGGSNPDYAISLQPGTLSHHSGPADHHG